jgi:hypothetical protein
VTTHNTHKRQTSMPPAGFEPRISTRKRPQTHSLDRAATRIGPLSLTRSILILFRSFQRACSSLRPHFITRLLHKVVSPSPKFHAGKPLLVACLRLIQYIRRHPPCLEAFSSRSSPKTRHILLSETLLSREYLTLAAVF